MRPRASNDPETGQGPRDLTAPDTLGRPDMGSGADDIPGLRVSSSLRVISSHEWSENKLSEKGPLRQQGTVDAQLGSGLETFLRQLLGVTELNRASMSTPPEAPGCRPSPPPPLSWQLRSPGTRDRSRRAWGLRPATFHLSGPHTASR